MPWNLIVSGLALALVATAWLFRRRPRRTLEGPMPDVGRPPGDAEPVAIPRMQDIGSASYELPLSEARDHTED